jgi:hypothetical protein
MKGDYGHASEVVKLGSARRINCATARRSAAASCGKRRGRCCVSACADERAYGSGCVALGVLPQRPSGHGVAALQQCKVGLWLWGGSKVSLHVNAAASMSLRWLGAACV